jgi:stage V sporulation protein K
MHMAFVGNPGTGKTTVARLFGQMLNKLGLLGSDVFVETDRAGLVGEYVGHTEKKTREVIRKATGGVLFVDEAYALNDRYGDRKGFGEEAVDVIVKEMEDRRDRLAVILAGYSDRMTDFLGINPGLKSRIPSVINFPDYTSDELIEIGQRIATTRGLQLDPEALAAMKGLLEGKKKEEGFGNAREVQNLMDAAQRNQLERLGHLGNLATDRESCLIRAEDIPKMDDQLRKQQLGFGRYI